MNNEIGKLRGMNEPQYVIRGKTTICDDFINQSIKTWENLKLSIQTGINLSEESITDFNLLELQSKHPYEIRTQKFSRLRESKVGADWEWWLGSQGIWLGLRIQAKKLNFMTLSYSELDKKNKYGQQIDLLIRCAFNNTPKLVPLYVFYNYWDVSVFDPPWLCGTYSKCLSMLGCGLTYAEYIKKILNNGSKSLKDISQVMYPWSCLVCCKGYSRENGNLPNRTFDFIVGAFRKEFVNKEFAKEDFITQKAPVYVYKIMEGVTLSEEDWERIKVDRITVIHKKEEK